jgi:ABC-type transport system involved in multi-copper enzyme maturation permease subunit
LFPLLAKPVTRNQLLFGKFLGCWFATGLSLLVFYLFFGIVTGAREHQWPVLNYFQAATLHWFMLGIVCAMSLLGSIIFAAPSSNNTITLIVSVGILLVGRHLNKVAVKMDEPVQSVVYALYFALPHLELFDVRDLIVHNWGLIRWEIWAAALGYAAVYAVLLLALACLAFRRKPMN